MDVIVDPDCNICWMTFLNRAFDSTANELVTAKGTAMLTTRNVADNVGEGKEINAADGYNIRRTISRINHVAQDRLDLSCREGLVQTHGQTHFWNQERCGECDQVHQGQVAARQSQ